MNQFEQNVRELAYQIWESEGQPIGHENRHWEMALKLAQLQKDISDESATGNIPKTFVSEGLDNSLTHSSVHSLSVQPEQSTSSLRPDISPHADKPAGPGSSIVDSSCASQHESRRLNRAAATKRKIAAAPVVAEDELAPASDVNSGDSKKSKRDKAKGAKVK